VLQIDKFFEHGFMGLGVPVFSIEEGDVIVDRVAHRREVY
jgi:hypothetical protein